MPGFTGSQADLLKALQFALRAADPGGGVGDVKLRHFRSGDAASVGHVEADRDSRAGGSRRRRLQVGEAEGGVAQPEAEGKERVLAGGGPVSVADQQAVALLYVADDIIHRRLAVFGYVQLGIRTLDGVVVRRRGILLPTAVEADRQLALGVALAEQNLGDGRAALLAGIVNLQQRGNLRQPAA